DRPIHFIRADKKHRDSIYNQHGIAKDRISCRNKTAYTDARQNGRKNKGDDSNETIHFFGQRFLSYLFQIIIHSLKKRMDQPSSRLNHCPTDNNAKYDRNPYAKRTHHFQPRNFSTKNIFIWIKAHHGKISEKPWNSHEHTSNQASKNRVS